MIVLTMPFLCFAISVHIAKGATIEIVEVNIVDH